MNANTSKVSQEKLERLAPLLGSLSRLVANGAELNDTELEMLLIGFELEHDKDCIKELKRWGKLLITLRDKPDKYIRNATVETLLVRGLSEAQVLLAVSTVSEKSSSLETTATQANLSVNVSSIEFGEIKAGETPEAEIEIEGGSGQVYVDSDELYVSPLNFGPGKTRLHVKLKPMHSDLLWTSIKLLTSQETIEIPVIAIYSNTRGEDMLFKPDEVTQGFWIKIGSSGNSFKVILHPNGSLTEWELFNELDSWSGEWEIIEGLLRLIIGEYKLDVSPEPIGKNYYSGTETYNGSFCADFRLAHIMYDDKFSPIE